ncbi:uncharacterized protein CDV56_105122 [Aspergillus thermomutatus]|uniref:Uncharacterized protein n=1 Tax=Aspergillus thermomutatus TaxID=41047 RepID=A0A397GKH3_ASPTH|nr:uncharacterized protein CDV56_105122 [Aspergillus thermomutatus]RHZ51027.1 hypothetical protein CDV56_105122 [Aspergillus thermomutatus]
MATPGTAQLQAGGVSASLSESEQVKEYEKILKISDDIFTGAHPRLKVPQQFVRKTTSRNAPNPPTPTRQAQVKTAGGQIPPQGNPSQSKPAAAGVASAQTIKTNGPSGVTSAPQSTRIVPKPTSEIDPIFLTKSDDLVRAELQLQRQRVERALREQLEQKKQESRQRAAMQDVKPDFDVSEVLNKAFELVPPSPSIDVPGPNGMEAPSDSYDESFDSSRAPDSPIQQKPSSAPLSNSEEVATEAPVENYSDELQRLEALNRPASDQEMQDTYPVADHQSQSQQAQVDRANNNMQATQQQADAFEEPEYSPPAPGIPPMESADFHPIEHRQPHTDKRRGQDQERPPSHQHRHKTVSPGDNVRVVRNHITSPAAPQPSRVSPLAIAKVPTIHHPKVPPIDDSSNRMQHARQDLRAASPDIPPQQLMPRKRRRLHEDRSRPRQVSYRSQAGGRAETHIKDEPVSPPPFADTPPAIQPQERPIYIDIASPRYTPVYERIEPMREPAYELDPYHEAQIEAAYPRTVSRLSVRRPVRDDQDLRRVASLHQARHPEYTREYIERPSSRSLRAASYAIVERPPQERVRYYDDVPQTYARHYVPAGGSPTSPRYQEAWLEGSATAPQGRILIDEHGNHYREKTPPPRMQAMPPPPGRIPRGEVYDDGAQIRPGGNVRAVSVVEDPYGGRRYVQEMPPPPTAYRRVTEYPRPAPSERRSYVTPLVDDREPYPRSSSVQVAGYPATRATYVEEADIPRERIIRMPSVRPPAAHYEEPREMIPRMGSVRPAARDVSVYVDDDARRPREYIERPVYVAPRPLAREERYYEGEPERVVLDGRETVHRVSQRY